MSNKDLGVAYSIRKQARKKMAKGGPVSAKTESRPMPSTEANDKAEIAKNSAQKPLVEAQATSRPELRQARRGLKTTPIKHPKMVHSDVLQARLMKEEDDLQAMAKGGMINEEVPMKAAEEDHAEHPAGLESDNDVMGDKDAMEDHMEMLARGGEVSPEPEIDMDHDSSIAAAIMAKRKRMAEGGQVDIDSNNEEQPNGFYPRNEDAALKENYDSDMDDVSQPMDSNEHGHELPDEDMHDKSLVEKIMMKRRKSPMTR